MKSKVYSDDEFYKLLNAASRTSHNPLKVSLLISLGGRCGLRTTECCNIKLKDIDFEQQLVWVATLKQRGVEKGKLRFIPVDKHTMVLLDTYINHMKIKNQETYLFPKRGDLHHHETRGGIAYMMVRLAQRAGVPNKGFKGLRHFFCTTNAPHMQALQLAGLTGHKNINSLRTYYHSNPEIIRGPYDEGVAASEERMKRLHPSFTK